MEPPRCPNRLDGIIQSWSHTGMRGDKVRTFINSSSFLLCVLLLLEHMHRPKMDLGHGQLQKTISIIAKTIA